MENVIQLLVDLVRIPSMNPMGRARTGAEYSEQSIATYVAEYLRKRRIDVELQEFAPGRVNVVAHVDTGAKRTVLLEAHLDTVHADAMSVPPFDAQIMNGRLQGRGACDTKGSLATVLDTVTSLLDAGVRLQYNVIVAAVADEEYQFTGAKAAVAGGLRADFGICGEPTQLHIVRAHKGVLRWRVRTAGQAAHSAYPDRGRNAIYAMAPVIAALEKYASALGRHRSHPVLGSPTLSVGVIEGGQAVNIVPDSCWIEVDRRTLPGESAGDILADVRATLTDIQGWSMDPPHLEAGGMETPEGFAELSRLRAMIEAAGVPAVVESARYATDGGIYATAGIPCVVFGPGDIADAHTAAESIDINEVLAARDILRRFLT
jgi:acetylornithine deacetylase/succinyl-diaminopimelate desuccinylase family protein